MSAKNKIIVLGITSVVLLILIAFRSNAGSDLNYGVVSNEYCAELFSKNKSNSNTLLADSIICQTNLVRKENNIPILIKNTLLQEAAQKKAEDMAKKGYFSHYGPDGRMFKAWIDESGYAYQAVGENLAVNYENHEELVGAWMESPSHKANILNKKFSEAGAGIAKGKYNGEEAVFIVEFYGYQRTGSEKILAKISGLFGGIL